MSGYNLMGVVWINQHFLRGLNFIISSELGGWWADLIHQTNTHDDLRSRVGALVGLQLFQRHVEREWHDPSPLFWDIQN